MTPIKQTVYIPVKIEDEKTEYGSKEFTIDSKNRKSVHHTLEILDENKDLYDTNGFLNFGDNSYVTHWLKPQEGYFFTPEQLNEYTQSVIKQALETAAENASMKEHEEGDWDVCWISNDMGDAYVLDKQSIKNTFEETFKQFEV